MDIDRAGVNRVVVSPNFAEQRISGEDDPWVADEIVQEVELFRLECQLVPAETGMPPGDIDFEVSGDHHRDGA